MGVSSCVTLNEDVVVTTEYAVPGHEITKVVGVVTGQDAHLNKETIIEAFVKHARVHGCQAVVSLQFNTMALSASNYRTSATALLVQLRKCDSDSEPNTARASMLQPNSNVYTYDDGV
ncbi:hypothetical protein BKA62DRAFT_769512 [Auriculariales sp. MPI-PUGE-AT-0066]|nr:hypothetical protein BKA62DRAFT_769512 [Auriculariales sp. MPI-PUGE-AT-0066]